MVAWLLLLRTAMTTQATTGELTAISGNEPSQVLKGGESWQGQSMQMGENLGVELAFMDCCQVSGSLPPRDTPTLLCVCMF